MAYGGKIDNKGNSAVVWLSLAILNIVYRLKTKNINGIQYLHDRDDNKHPVWPQSALNPYRWSTDSHGSDSCTLSTNSARLDREQRPGWVSSSP